MSDGNRILSRLDMDCAAKSLRAYAKNFDNIHRDIADDLRAGAQALELISEDHLTITVKP